MNTNSEPAPPRTTTGVASDGAPVNPETRPEEVGRVAGFPRVLAVMQNQWFKDPDRVRAMIARDTTGHLRARLIHYALFAGCHSGKILLRVFGDRVHEWTWDEASTAIGGHAAAVFPADHEHLRGLIASVKPDIVLAFGSIAGNALAGILAGDAKPKLILAPHPAARGKDVMSLLQGARNNLDSAMLQK